MHLFTYIKTSLHLWNKLNLIVIYNLLLCYWVQFVNFFLENSSGILVYNFLFFIMSLSGFSIRLTIALQNTSGKVLSLLVLWDNLRWIVTSFLEIWQNLLVKSPGPRLCLLGDCIIDSILLIVIYLLKLPSSHSSISLGYLCPAVHPFILSSSL